MPIANKKVSGDNMSMPPFQISNIGSNTPPEELHKEINRVVGQVNRALIDIYSKQTSVSGKV